MEPRLSLTKMKELVTLFVRRANSAFIVAFDLLYPDTDQDIDNLIEKTEKEGDQEEALKEGLSFAFAKIWAADKNTLEEIEDQDQVDSWAQTLEKITIEREKEQVQEIALSGRGARRRAADVAKACSNILGLVLY